MYRNGFHIPIPLVHPLMAHGLILNNERKRANETKKEVEKMKDDLQKKELSFARRIKEFGRKQLKYEKELNDMKEINASKDEDLKKQHNYYFLIIFILGFYLFDYYTKYNTCKANGPSIA
tara:strand:- start:152 stop:511 length:360 start_codon:yes stop_codon:yes gene_type:complete